MKLGLSTYSYGWAVGIIGSKPDKQFTVFDLLQDANKYGLQLVQIGDNLPLEHYLDEELEAIYNYAKNKKIDIELGTRGFTLKQIELYLQIAKKLHSKFIRIVTDQTGYEPSADMIIEITKQVLPLLIESGVTLGIENHDRFLSKQLVDIIRSINSPNFGICLDTANSFGAGEEIKSVVNNLAPLTVNVHIKDYIIRRMDHLMGFIIEGSPAGAGMLDVPEIIRIINQFGKNPNIILELWTPSEGNLKDTIIKEEKWVEQSILYLKTII